MWNNPSEVFLGSRPEPCISLYPSPSQYPLMIKLLVKYAFCHQSPEPDIMHRPLLTIVLWLYRKYKAEPPSIWNVAKPRLKNVLFSMITDCWSAQIETPRPVHCCVGGDSIRFRNLQLVTETVLPIPVITTSAKLLRWNTQLSIINVLLLAGKVIGWYAVCTPFPLVQPVINRFFKVRLLLAVMRCAAPAVPSSFTSVIWSIGGRVLPLGWFASANDPPTRRTV